MKRSWIVGVCIALAAWSSPANSETSRIVIIYRMLASARAIQDHQLIGGQPTEEEDHGFLGEGGIYFAEVHEDGRVEVIHGRGYFNGPGSWAGLQYRSTLSRELVAPLFVEEREPKAYTYGAWCMKPGTEARGKYHVDGKCHGADAAAKVGLLLESEVIKTSDSLSCSSAGCALQLERGQYGVGTHDDGNKRLLDGGYDLLLRDDGMWRCAQGETEHLTVYVGRSDPAQAKVLIADLTRLVPASARASVGSWYEAVAVRRGIATRSPLTDAPPALFESIQHAWNARVVPLTSPFCSVALHLTH